MPESSRGRGCCTGLGRISDSGMVKNRPLNVHRVRSPAGDQGVDEFVAAGAAGARVDVHDLMLLVGPADAEAGHQPALPDSRSMVDSCWASATGRCSPATRMLVPTTGRVVQAAAAVSVSSAARVLR